MHTIIFQSCSELQVTCRWHNCTQKAIFAVSLRKGRQQVSGYTFRCKTHMWSGIDDKEGSDIEAISHE